MIEFFIEILSYSFMQKAFITGIVIAIAASLLGCFLVLRRYALLGDGLAHISFGGIAFGLLFNIAPFFSALVFAILGSFSILKLKEKQNVYSDSAIGIISHASLGFGIFIVSIANGFNVDILSYLFGSILAIKVTEMYFSIGIAIIVLVIIFYYFYDLFYISFDEESAKASGIPVSFLNAVIIVLTAITVVGAMNVVGLLLASMLIILPPSTALQLKLSFRKTLLAAMSISVLSVIIGLVVSFAYDLAPSGTIVMINLLFFLIALLIGQISKMKTTKVFLEQLNK